MGERGLSGFVVDGQEKLAYHHWGSPNGVGLFTLEWLRIALDGGPDALRKAVRGLRVVTEDEKPTEQDVLRLQQRYYKDVSTGLPTDWYALLRETQGRLDLMLESGVVLDQSDFALDSLFCEWAFVVDLDAETYEVYKGFQKVPPTQGRWVGVGEPPTTGDYWPVQRVAVWPLAALPSDEEMLKLEETD